jgi:poly(3-hydroxybutyrate) depolymerase
MFYQLFQAQQDMLLPLRAMARSSTAALRDLQAAPPAFPLLRRLNAAAGVTALLRTTHARPAFALDPVRVGNRLVAVEEAAVLTTPFATLLHFRKPEVTAPQPRMLVVAPMSGHFATLLRNTVQVLLPEMDVYVTDWANARDVPLEAGRFGFDQFVAHVIRFLEACGRGTHALAVCQPVVAVLAAAALMAEDHNPAQPRSLALLAGPIDTRLSPTEVNRLAQSKPIDWFARNLIATVPLRHKGAGRRVYPGALQLAAFMAMNSGRHREAMAAQYRALAEGDTASAAARQRFYEEYFAVMDLPAEFYLETVATVFQDHALPRGALQVAGRRVRPEAMRRTALLTVEGERDDICGIGQTMAALDLCTGVRPSMKRHHLQTGVGHYGVFSGKRWAQGIYPRVRAMVQVSETTA